MGEKGNAFLKGGVGCFIVFAVLALLALMLGGSVHIDLGGIVLLFVIGGVIGLIVLVIYNKGKKDARRRRRPRQTPRHMDDIEGWE